MEYKDYSLPQTPLVISPMDLVESEAQPIDDASIQTAEIGDGVRNLTLTSNSAVTYKSTLSACLDFFNEVQEGCAPLNTNELLETAWKEDANVTLRLIFQLRDVRDGKGVRDPFLYCLLWLRKHHFQTLLYNLDVVAKVGCWKDLLELLVFEVIGVDEYVLWTSKRTKKAYTVYKWRKERKNNGKNNGKNTKAAKGHKKIIYGKEYMIDKQQAIKKARKSFVENKEYQQLHIRVAALFAEALKKDLESLKKEGHVSLASKWAPTACKYHDKLTLITSTISQLLFAQKDYCKGDRTYAQYVSITRDLYRKVYISPLRKYSKVAERFMSKNKWADIPYSAVPSRCMLQNKKLFAEKDEARFEEFLSKVKKGKTTIKASALNPHQMVAPFLLGGRTTAMVPAEIATLQLQWDAYVNKLKKSGTLDSCLAICDVSGSMRGLPLEVAVALSILVAEIAEPPFKRIILTFSTDPELFLLPEGGLESKVSATVGMNWTMATDVEKAFDLILSRAVDSQVPKEKMIRKLFIFSDMQFNEASVSGKTNHEVAKNKFNAAGYDLPHVVYWNVAASGIAPVVKHENNTALISGFSGQLLKLFMNDVDNLDSFSPILILMKAIESYTYLKVID